MFNEIQFAKPSKKWDCQEFSATVMILPITLAHFTFDAKIQLLRKYY